VIAARGHDAHQAELDDAKAAGSNRQGRQQPDERVSGKRDLPGHLSLRQAHPAQARQQDQPQGQLAGRGRGSDPPAALGEQAGRTVPEALQGGGTLRERPARELASDGADALQGLLRAERQRLAG
jgi:hypothetical protein